MDVKRILACALLGGMMVVTAACGSNSADKTITPVAQAETVNKMPNFTNAPIADEYAIFDTNYGQFKVRLLGSKAPITVKNFDYLVKKGFYNGVTFHRVIEGFMIQGGDPTGTGMGGESSFGGSFQDEFSKELYNLRGALSMANAGPDTNGSQFFIVQTPEIPYSKKELERGGWPAPIAEAYAENGGTPHLDHRHTVFGQLVDEASYKVLDEIASVEVGAQDKPLEDVVIETVEVAD